MANRPAADLLLVCCTVLDGALAVLVRTGPSSALPRHAVRAGALDAAAAAATQTLLGYAPGWLAQAHADLRTETRAALLEVVYASLVPSGAEPPSGYRWLPVAKQRTLAAPESVAVMKAIGLLRARMDLEPVAFRLLPARFTLAELQAVYELLLGRRLHKASFRRALAGAFLVVPTDHWRTEGRGRPAQLFRYAPRGGRGARRAVRFDLLS